MFIKKVYPSALGDLTLIDSGQGLCALVAAGQRYEARHLPEAACLGETPTLDAACRWLDAYFAGDRPDGTGLCLAPEGTAFQKRVWQELLTIPYGKTESYGQIAARLSSSPRAVGAAVGRNPISILIPCHRVLGSGGALVGYAGGLERKRFLLTLEGALYGEE